MKHSLQFILVLLLSTFSVQAQLYVQPTTGPSPDSYIYANDTFIFVTEDIELVENAANGGVPSIALRNQAQLLQGNNAATNKGNGEISIYQEGTTDNYSYNFWASPVGVEGDNATISPDGNTDFSLINGEEVLFLPTTELSSNVALDAPGFDGSVAPLQLQISKFWLFSYQSNSTAAGDSTNDSWVPIQGTSRLGAGWGFSMKGVSGIDMTDVGETTVNNAGSSQRYDFRGRPNNGIVEDVFVGANLNSLVGNPYPSALDLSYFLLENSGSGTATYTCDGNTTTIDRRDVTTGVAYFWESDPAIASHFLEDYEGGYGTFSPMGNTCTAGIYVPATFTTFNELGEAGGPSGNANNFVTERRFSPVGQGFFVVGDDVQSEPSNPTTITFNNEQRIYVPEGAATSSEFRTSEEEATAVPGIAINRTYRDVTNLPQVSQIKLAVGVNDTYARQLSIGFVDNATKGIDTAIDAANRSPLPTDISFDLEGAQGTEKENGFVINGVPFDESQWVPLLIKAQELSEFRFKIFETVDFPFSEVFLYDAQTDTFHDILNDEALLLLSGDLYTERFYVRFTKSNDSTEEEETTEEETTEEETTEEETNEEETTDVDTQDDTEETTDNTEDQNTEEDTTEENQDTEETTEDTSNEESEESEEASEETTNDEDTDASDTSGDDILEDDQSISTEEQNPFIEESILESFIITQNNVSSRLEITNPLNVELTHLMLFDLTGKKVVNRINLETLSQYNVPTNNFATGIYVVSFITKSGLRKSRKISIVN